MRRIFGIALLLSALASCRDYDFHSRLASQGGLLPPDQFARYGREQSDEVAIAREFGAAIRRSSPDDLIKGTQLAAGYARALPEIVDVQADPLGYRLTLRFKSGWRTMVNPIEDGKRGAEAVGLPARAGVKTPQ
jgi:hypothetical protein